MEFPDIPNEPSLYSDRPMLLEKMATSVTKAFYSRSPDINDSEENSAHKGVQFDTYIHSPKYASNPQNQRMRINTTTMPNNIELSLSAFDNIKDLIHTKVHDRIE